MIIINPILFSDANLSGFNVPEPDTGETVWDSSTAYVVGDRVARTNAGVHNIYEALQANTNSIPENNPDNWVYVSRTNRWSMFPRGVPGSDFVLRDQISEQTTNPGTIQFTFTPGQVADGISFFNVEGQSIQVVVTDPVEGIVYDNTVTLDDSAPLLNWFDYFFTPIRRRRDLVLLDLPPYGSATITVTISNDAGNAACGLVSIGKQVRLGTTNYGTSGGIIDYSRREANTFGQFVVVQRLTSNRVDYDVLVNTSEAAAVRNTLNDLRTTALTFVGEDDQEFSINYGYYRDFNIILSDPVGSICTIEVEGLT